MEGEDPVSDITCLFVRSSFVVNEHLSELLLDLKVLHRLSVGAQCSRCFRELEDAEQSTKTRKKVQLLGETCLTDVLKELKKVVSGWE